jgi:beta-N-acetylhexosaminidase
MSFFYPHIQKYKGAFGAILLAIISVIGWSFTLIEDKDKKITDFDMYLSNQWVDSVFKSMTEDQRIGQLFMVAAYSNRDSNHVDQICELVSNYHIGGLIFFQGGPYREAVLTNYYQSIAKVPLLISMDAEWGLSMRLDSTIRFPKQMTLGAIQDNQLIYDFGAVMAEQCKRIGIHVNLAPVVDVNNNPLNPVINDRSFGEDKYNVAAKSIAYMSGMQNNGVLANAKHFPGHGNTDQDSHKTLPTVNRNRDQIDSLELYPFRQLMSRGLSSVMVAHLFVPAIDTTPNVASTLSKVIVSDLLKKDMEYRGLVFTDALNMKGVSAFYEPGEVDVKALLAGNDVLLFSEDVPKAINEIKSAIQQGKITINEINQRVKKVLKAKYVAGLNQYKPISMQHIHQDLNNTRAEVLRRRLYEASITVLRNKGNVLPLNYFYNQKIAVLSVNGTGADEFAETLQHFGNVAMFKIADADPINRFNVVEAQLKSYGTVLVAFHGMSSRASRNFGLESKMLAFINKIGENQQVIPVVFGNPYALKYFGGFEPVIVAYEDNPITREAAAQVVFGVLPATGKLPVTASTTFNAKEGYELNPKGYQLRFAPSFYAGINEEKLQKIDAIAKEAIAIKATPGCQILVARNRKIIYHKAFGAMTYNSKDSIKLSSIYDIASVTKIAATTLAVMKLHEKGQIDVSKKLSQYLPYLKNSNKKDLTIAQIMTHTAGLQAWIPFYKTSLAKDAQGNYENYRQVSNKIYSLQVADKMFLKNTYVDQIYKEITDSPLGEIGKYVYSDLGFYLLKDLVEKVTEQSFEDYLNTHFYTPLGLTHTAFNPLNRFQISDIAPTELDKDFRKQLVRGYVHDPGAAMLGGVSGHAGLFSNAYDLCKIMQMLLDDGYANGVQLLKPETVKLFTSRYNVSNRRGLGFDKPETNPTLQSPVSKYVSSDAFGHSGFTGTFVWADPKYNLVYIFLSNRVHPDAENKLLQQKDIRTRIQDVIYESIEK